MNKTTKVLLLSLVLFIVALAYIYQPTRDVDTITTSFPESEGDLTSLMKDLLTQTYLIKQARRKSEML